MNMPCDICGSSVTDAYKNMYDDRYGYPSTFVVTQCPSCNTLATQPPLTAAEIGPLYTNYYPRSVIDLKTVERRGSVADTLHQRFTYWWNGNHKIQHMLQTQGGGRRILDIGCGDGASLIELKRRGFDVYGIEADENVAVVRDAFKLPIHIGMIEDCPFPERSFDLIIANQVIEHIVDLDSFIKHIQKFLAPHGRVIISTPNGNSVYRKIFGKKWAHWHIPYHQHIMNKKALGLLLAKHGFHITQSKTVSPTTWMIHTLNRLRFTPVLGKKNPLWAYEQKDTINSSEHKQDSLKAQKRPGTIYAFFKRLLYITVLAIISLCNRIVDVFRAGDCIVVTAKITDVSA